MDKGPSGATDVRKVCCRYCLISGRKSWNKGLLSICENSKANVAHGLACCFSSHEKKYNGQEKTCLRHEKISGYELPDNWRDTNESTGGDKRHAKRGKKFQPEIDNKCRFTEYQGIQDKNMLHICT